jgi:tripartite ATP-independent transporter DctP family solute receptor
MAIHSRRRLTLGAAAAMTARAMLPGAARAARFSFRCATLMPAAHPLNIRLQEAFDRIGQESAGEIHIQLFPESRLGGDIEMLAQLGRGQIDFAAVPAQVLGMAVPVASITSLGYAFTGYEQVWPALDGQLGAHIAAAIVAAGFTPCGRVWDDGFHQITHHGKLITKLADLKNLRIRVANGPVGLTLFKDFGAAPAAMNFVDLYRALETRIFDGEENSLAVIELAQITKLHSFCSITNHMWDGFWLLANGAGFALLPADARAIIVRNMSASALAQRADLRAMDAKLRKAFEDRGMTVNVPPTIEYRTALTTTGFYSTWKRRFGPVAWTLLEQSTGALA